MYIFYTGSRFIVPFKIAFSQPPVPHAKPPTPSKETLDLTPPLIQISLPGDSSPESAERLGEVLEKLRRDGWGVVCTGQAVHNLRDLRESRGVLRFERRRRTLSEEIRVAHVFA